MAVGAQARIAKRASRECATERRRITVAGTLLISNEETIMKTELLLSCLVACSLAGLVPLSASADPAMDTSGSEAKLVIKDSAITSSLKARFESDQIGGFKHIHIDTDDRGIVTLKGHVRTQDAADRAVSITRETAGVREVRNDIKIKIDD